MYYIVNMGILRRTIGILIAICPFAIVILLTIYDWRLHRGQSAGLGYTLLVLGGLASITNFYLQVLRYPIHCLIHGKDKEYKWESGIPLVGGLSVLGFLFIPKAIWLSILVFVLICIDFCGLHYFVIFTWKDDSLWNPEKVPEDERMPLF